MISLLAELNNISERVIALAKLPKNLVGHIDFLEYLPREAMAQGIEPVMYGSELDGFESIEPTIQAFQSAMQCMVIHPNIVMKNQGHTIHPVAYNGHKPEKVPKTFIITNIEFDGVPFEVIADWMMNTPPCFKTLYQTLEAAHDQ